MMRVSLKEQNQVANILREMHESLVPETRPVIAPAHFERAFDIAVNRIAEVMIPPKRWHDFIRISKARRIVVPDDWHS